MKRLLFYLEFIFLGVTGFGIPQRSINQEFKLGFLYELIVGEKMNWGAEYIFTSAPIQPKILGNTKHINNFKNYHSFGSYCNFRFYQAKEYNLLLDASLLLIPNYPVVLETYKRINEWCLNGYLGVGIEFKVRENMAIMLSYSMGYIARMNDPLAQVKNQGLIGLRIIHNLKN